MLSKTKDRTLESKYCPNEHADKGVTRSLFSLSKVVAHLLDHNG